MLQEISSVRKQLQRSHQSEQELRDQIEKLSQELTRANEDLSRAKAALGKAQEQIQSQAQAPAPSVTSSLNAQNTQANMHANSHLSPPPPRVSSTQGASASQSLSGSTRPASPSPPQHDTNNSQRGGASTSTSRLPSGDGANPYGLEPAETADQKKQRPRDPTDEIIQFYLNGGSASGMSNGHSSIHNSASSAAGSVSGAHSSNRTINNHVTPAPAPAQAQAQAQAPVASQNHGNNAHMERAAANTLHTSSAPSTPGQRDKAPSVASNMSSPVQSAPTQVRKGSPQAPPLLIRPDSNSTAAQNSLPATSSVNANIMAGSAPVQRPPVDARYADRRAYMEQARADSSSNNNSNNNNNNNNAANRSSTNERGSVRSASVPPQSAHSQAGFVVTAQVVKARNLPEGGRTFVAVRLAGEAFTTRHVDSPSPVWNETFEFSLAAVNSEEMITFLIRLASEVRASFLTRNASNPFGVISNSFWVLGGAFWIGHC